MQRAVSTHWKRAAHMELNFLSLLQFADGLFPAGAYAHSFGLESYAAAGTIRDATGVERFLLGVSARLRGAHRCGRSCRVAAKQRLSNGPQRWNSASPSTKPRRHEARERTARRQPPDGETDLARCSQSGEPFASHGLTATFLDAVENRHTPGHHAMAFGMIGGVLDGRRRKWPARISIRRARHWLARRCA